ncbi:hypothetical protein QBC38DRAFT_461676 [Podospora fimiseda]|uniref:Uncharacterized protein n=1 Tax=Podospora fimiseda TaxID=252190 RepID=A0AAN6YNY8_9PEZI|nr:hypothetical protein QBC38DRAFT_461676 [Podospora fimiseda]
MPDHNQLARQGSVGLLWLVAVGYASLSLGLPSTWTYDLQWKVTWMPQKGKKRNFKDNEYDYSGNDTLEILDSFPKVAQFKMSQTDEVLPNLGLYLE